MMMRKKRVKEGSKGERDELDGQIPRPLAQRTRVRT